MHKRKSRLRTGRAGRLALTGKLPEKEKEKIFDYNYIDLIIRDTKIKKAHAA